MPADLHVERGQTRPISPTEAFKRKISPLRTGEEGKRTRNGDDPNRSPFEKVPGR